MEKVKLEYEEEIKLSMANIKTHEKNIEVSQVGLVDEKAHLAKLEIGLEETKKVLGE